MVDELVYVALVVQDDCQVYSPELGMVEVVNELHVWVSDDHEFDQMELPHVEVDEAPRGLLGAVIVTHTVSVVVTEIESVTVWITAEQVPVAAEQALADKVTGTHLVWPKSGSV